MVIFIRKRESIYEHLRQLAEDAEYEIITPNDNDDENISADD